MELLGLKPSESQLQALKSRLTLEPEGSVALTGEEPGLDLVWTWFSPGFWSVSDFEVMARDLFRSELDHREVQTEEVPQRTDSSSRVILA